MRLPQLLLAAAAIVLATATVQAAPKTPRHGAVSPYVAELNAQCRARDLQDLSAGDLEQIMEGFDAKLAPAQRRKIQDMVGYRCARIEAGLTCANGATLKAYRRLGVLRQFVTEACASGWTCHGLGDCVQIKP
jgi:hypothetical protein